MAAGDAYVLTPTSVADTAFLALQPGAGVEIVIHNVYVPANKAVEFYWYNGTDSTLFDSSAADGTRYGMQWHCTNTIYVRVKNVSGGAIFIGADGMTTK
jgi:hypothetical protein